MPRSISFCCLLASAPYRGTVEDIQRIGGTDLFEQFAKVEDIAAAVCFLVSDEANMITGAILPVDGGWTAR